jgi:hypothetical protein
MERRHVKHETSFEERFAEEADRHREQAKRVHGQERDDSMRRARQAETALQINAWITSPGLASPK